MATTIAVGLVCLLLGAGGVLACLWLAIKWGIMRPPSPEDM
jgi:hypothetical protein